MPTPRGTNVGAIEVALGVNLTQLNKDLGAGQASLAKAGAPIEVPLRVVADIASAEAARKKIISTVGEDIEVRAHVVYDAGGGAAGPAAAGGAAGGAARSPVAISPGDKMVLDAARKIEHAGQQMEEAATKVSTAAKATTAKPGVRQPASGAVGGAVTGATEATQVERDLQTASGGTMTPGTTRRVLSKAAKAVDRPVETARDTQRTARKAAAQVAPAPTGRPPFIPNVPAGEAYGAGSSYLGTSQAEMRRASEAFEATRGLPREQLMGIIGPMGFENPEQLKGITYNAEADRLRAPRGKGRAWQGRMRQLNAFVSEQARRRGGPGAAMFAAPPAPPTAGGELGPSGAQVVDTRGRGVRGARLAFTPGEQRPEDAEFVAKVRGRNKEQFDAEQNRLAAEAASAPTPPAIAQIKAAFESGDTGVLGLGGTRDKGGVIGQLLAAGVAYRKGGQPEHNIDEDVLAEHGLPGFGAEPNLAAANQAAFSSSRILATLRPKWFKKLARTRRGDLAGRYGEFDPGYVAAYQATKGLRSSVYAEANRQAEDQAAKELGERLGANAKARKAAPERTPTRSLADQRAVREYENLGPHPEPMAAPKESPINYLLPSAVQHSRITERPHFIGDLEARAGGGPVEGALARRLREAREKREGTYLVGEKRPELYVSDTGKAEVVGQHGPEIRQFSDPGRIEPTVPTWIARMAKNAKDFTPRAEGGPVEPNLRFRDQRGRYISNTAAQNIAAQAGGPIQRVLVTNWPSGLTQTGTGGVRRAMSPRLNANQFTDADVEGLGPEAQAQARGQGFGAPRTTRRRVTTGPAGTARLTAVPDLAPEETARMERERFEESLRVSSETAEAKSRVAEELQRRPTRNISTAGVQIAEQAAGRTEVVERVRAANTALGQAAAVRRKLIGYQKDEEKAQKALNEEQDKGLEANPDRVEKLSGVLAKASANVREFTTLNEKYTAVAKEATEATKDGASPLKLLGVGFGASIGTITLFSAAMQGMQAATSGASQVISPLIERATGFRTEAGKEISVIADLTRQQHGYVSVALAQTAAQAGLADSTRMAVTAQLSQVTAAEAGSKALTEQITLMHTAMAAQGQGTPGYSAGLLQPSGGYLGLTRSTGGLLGSPIGAQPSIVEQMLGELPTGQLPAAQGVFNQIGAAPEGLPVIGPILDWFKGLNSTPQRGTPNNEPQNVLNKTNAYLKLYNDQVQKANVALKLVTVGAGAAGDALIKASDKSLALAGVTQDQIAVLDRNRIALVGPGNKAVGSKAGLQYLQGYATGSLQPTPQEELAQLAPQIAAQRAGILAQGQLQREQINPAQFALQTLAQPLMPFGSTFNLGAAGGTQGGFLGSGTGQQTKSQVDTVRTSVTQLDRQIQTMTQQGREAMMRLVPPELQQQFGALVGQIQSMGQQIEAAQQATAMRDAALAAAQYGNEIRVANRSLTDAKQITGQLGATTGDNLGLYERESILLDRQSQSLSLMIQQRQILTQLAVAQFQAPGETPEERYARQQEQITAAKVAQSQLNIQKQQFGVGVQIVDIQNVRAVTDMIQQIKLMQQGRSVQILDAADAERLTRLQKLMAQAQAQAATFLSSGEQIQQQAIQTGVQVAIDTGKAFSAVLNQTQTAWNTFATQAAQAMAGIIPGSGGGLTSNTINTPAWQNYRQGERNTTNTSTKNAPGMIDTANTPTTVTYGEAGTETVAILRNVRQGSLSGGGGGSSITFNVQISGNSVRSEDDLTSLAVKVAAEVEKRLARKAQLSGLRFPSY